MKRTRIKICGIRDIDAAGWVAGHGADAVGLVFVDGSPRQVDLDTARGIAETLPPFVEPVGLFVDAPTEKVLETARYVGLDTVQLHGSETPAYAAALMPLRVIKCLAMNERTLDEDVRLWRDMGPNLAGILIDAPAAGKTLPGGNARTFDWSMLAQVMQPDWPPLVLAGGLHAGNVGDAMRIVQPYAVDTSSGVECSRGVKDQRRIAEFCQAVRDADQALVTAAAH